MASQLSGSLYFEANTNAEWTSAYTADLVALPLTAASGILAVLVMTKVAQAQRPRLAQQPLPSSPDPWLNL